MDIKEKKYTFIQALGLLLRNKTRMFSTKIFKGRPYELLENYDTYIMKVDDYGDVIFSREPTKCPIRSIYKEFLESEWELITKDSK
jgi:hypothetical protein